MNMMNIFVGLYGKIICIRGEVNSVLKVYRVFSESDFWKQFDNVLDLCL